MSYRMHLKINMNVKDNNWKPGFPLINDPTYNLSSLPSSDKLVILNEFSKYLSEEMKNLLVSRVKFQYRYLRWAPLSEGYLNYKRKVGLSENIWEATGYLINSINVYKRGNYYVIGIHPNKKYPKSKVSVLFVAKCMEFGTRYMPARPLFGPTIRFMRRNVRRYWEKFLLDESIMR